MNKRYPLPAPGVVFELDHVRVADVPPPYAANCVSLRVLNVREVGYVTITCGYDERGLMTWLVSYMDPKLGVARTGWAYDRRTADRWAQDWPQDN